MGLARQPETLQAEGRSGSVRASRKANPRSGKQYPDSKNKVSLLKLPFPKYRSLFTVRRAVQQDNPFA
ncbi:hypothetical protein C2I06_02010 [Niallia circulans]|nr:hypothetical protein C2I06_02010 [Niallia circulans]AYV71449.1 hypothetical protein C2H98_07530 [Niallia circulans]